ncbi:MAG: DUF2141 domain-containing protein [Bacteroidia bacterium]|nr:DUF2141 domain-containing protein [Bacteroidia bacterium]
MIKKFLYAAILILLVTPAMNLYSQNVEVTITGLKSTKGQIVIGVFRDGPTFQKEEAFLSKKYVKKDIINGVMTIHFTMEPGLYGLSLLDDVNSSGLMEYSFIGIPKEGFGFSDYYHTGLTKPKFDSFKFTLEKDQKKKITIRVRYM